ncbi:MAG: hypothetical protein AAGF54_15830 [Pseudomonadota bacterium]
MTRLFVSVFLISLAFLPLCFTSYFPMVDFYRHIVRYYVIAKHILGSADQFDYIVHWNVTLNMSGDILSTAFFLFFSPELASKILIASAILIIVFGVLALDYVVNKKFEIWKLAAVCIFIFNHVFFWGFMNYLIALGLSFWLIALWIWLRERSLVAALVTNGAAGALLFISHGFAFMMFGYALALYEIGRTRFSITRRPSIEVIIVLLGLLVSAVPATILLFYIGFQEYPGSKGFVDRIQIHIQENTLLDRLFAILSDRLMIVFRQVETDYPLWDILYNSTIFGMIACGFIFGWLNLSRRWVVVLLGLVFAYVVLPPNFFGVGYVPDRIPTMAILLLLGVVRLTVPKRGATIASLTAGLLLVRTVVLSITWATYAPVYEEVRNWKDVIPSGSIVLDLTPHRLLRKEPDALICALGAAPYLWLSNANVRTFDVKGILPISISGRLKEAISNGQPIIQKPHHEKDWPAFADHVLQRTARSGADFVLICDEEHYLNPPSDYMDLVAKNEIFTLYKTRDVFSQAVE